MVLYFKLDEKNRLWLMFCTGLKLREKGHYSSQMGLPKKKNDRALSPVMCISTRKEDLNQQPEIPSEYLLEDQVNQANINSCLKCGKEELLYDVKMSILLDHEEKIMKGIIPEDVKEEEEDEGDKDDSNIKKPDFLKKKKSAPP